MIQRQHQKFEYFSSSAWLSNLIWLVSIWINNIPRIQNCRSKLMGILKTWTNYVERWEIWLWNLHFCWYVPLNMTSYSWCSTCHLSMETESQEFASRWRHNTYTPPLVRPTKLLTMPLHSMMSLKILQAFAVCHTFCFSDIHGLDLPMNNTNEQLKQLTLTWKTCIQQIDN